MIEIRDLTVIHARGRRAVHAVNGVSLHVARGEALGLIGESGCGKSSLLRAICGLAPISSGSIVIDGRIVSGPRDAWFCKTVQMVFQNPHGSLHPYHMVDQILSEPLTIHRFNGPGLRVERALEDVGLDVSFRFRYPHQLSSGQRQRVAIARALILEPRLLLLDEPTASLDASVQAGILNLLDHLREERGLSYLFVSHDLAVVNHVCDRFLVMRAGKTMLELCREDLRNRALPSVGIHDLWRSLHGEEKSHS